MCQNNFAREAYFFRDKSFIEYLITFEVSRANFLDFYLTSGHETASKAAHRRQFVIELNENSS